MRVSFASEPGSAAKPNEDWVQATDTAVIVLDGLTSPDELGTGCVHGTSWYVRMLAANAFRRLADEPTADLANVVGGAVEGVADAHRDTCDLTHPGSPCATVALLREAGDSVDYLVLSDATVVLDTVDGLHVINDQRVETVALAEVSAVRAVPPGTPEQHRLLADLVTAQRELRNREGGYWVAQTDPRAVSHALTGSVARLDIRQAAILSDGASCLVDTFGLATWTDVLSLMAAEGPEAHIRRVRAAEVDDPEARRWPRYKRADDATAAWVAFG